MTFLESFLAFNQSTVSRDEDNVHKCFDPCQCCDSCTSQFLSSNKED